MNGGSVPFNIFSTDATNNVENNFSYYAQSATLPAVTVNKADIPYFGKAFHVPTSIQYEHDWTIKFLLTENMNIYEGLRQWMLMFSNLRLSGGGYKLVPNIDMRISLLNAAQTHFTSSQVLVGCWPNDLSDLKQEYKDNDNNVATCNLKIKYQYCYRDDNFNGRGNPLRA